MWVWCWMCHGTGKDIGEVECKLCHGKGGWWERDEGLNNWP